MNNIGMIFKVRGVKMESINKIIKDLPLGSSTLIEERINHKNTTIIVIKDKFKGSIDNPWDIDIKFKGGIVKNKNILSAHILIRFKDNFNEKYYPFHFNYFDENSLKLLHNLTKQKEIYIVISDIYGQYIYETLNNNIKPFLKKYMKKTIRCGKFWNNNEYKNSITDFIKSFHDINELWDSMGDEIYMEYVKK